MLRLNMIVVHLIQQTLFQMDLKLETQVFQITLQEHISTWLGVMDKPKNLAMQDRRKKCLGNIII